MIGLFGIGPPFQRQCIFWKPVLVVFVFVRDAKKVGFGFSGNCQCGLDC
jgi:hypothetical protein